MFNNAVQTYTEIPNDNSNRVYVNYTRYVPYAEERLVITLSTGVTINKIPDENKYIYFTSQDITKMMRTITSESQLVSGTVQIQTYINEFIDGDSTNIWWGISDTSSTRPTITGSVTVTEINNAVSNNTGGLRFIAGYSNAQVDFTGSASAKNGAMIKM